MNTYAIIFTILILVCLIYLHIITKSSTATTKEKMSVSNRGFYNYLPYDDSITGWDYYWEQPWWERVVGRQTGPVAPGTRGWWYSNRY